MSKKIDEIDDESAAWIGRQHIFFVATAPAALDGHINCSPKGGDCFRIIGPGEVAYVDFTGSGAETIAHLRENGRIVVMFCDFDGKPRILRIHGHGEVVMPWSPQFELLAGHFPSNPGTRAIIRVAVERLSTSCGFSVPLMDFKAHRDVLDKWAASKGADGLAEYRATKNAISIDGLPALPDQVSS